MSRVLSVEEEYGTLLSPTRLDELIQRVSGWALLYGRDADVTSGYPILFSVLYRKRKSGELP